jgi:hypothetical protein
MKFVTAALIAVCALLAIYVGIARAGGGGGATIATAPVATPGILEPGSTSAYTDPCGNGYEFWKLPLEQGDLVKITWGAPAAVDTLALWTPETVDTDHPPCLYQSGFSHWTGSRLLMDTNALAGTQHLAQTTVTEDGTYPLLFLNTTGANAGVYSFTAVVLHAASVTLPHLSRLTGIGTLTASVVAPDGDPITDASLTLTLNGYWGNRTHKLGTATPDSGQVTFNYSLPSTSWGKKIQLAISGGGLSYQDVTTPKEPVTVLVPFGSPIGLVPSSALKTASKLLHQPIYWAGPRKGLHYEFWRLTNGNIYLRYLPHGVKAGVQSSKYLIVGTYRLANAYKKLKKFCGRKAVAGPHGSVYCALPGDPKSVYVAFPNVNYEVEVYDPNPKVSKAIAATGRVTPVR